MFDSSIPATIESRRFPMPHETPLILFGGSFDPVHNAHLEIAERALSALGAERVLFIPAAQSPLKTHTTAASTGQRLAMLRLAIADKPRFEICEWELAQGGKSFSIDTVRHVANLHPHHPLYWLIGTDQLAQLPKWRDIDELGTLLTFAVYRRAGSAAVTAPEGPDLRVTWLEGPQLPANSTAIRQDPATLHTNVPKNVAAFIRQHGLYGSS